MADQFDAFQQEVEEDLQREKFQKFLQKNQNYLLGAAAAIVLAVGGWKFVEARRQSAAEAASARYAAALKIATEKPGEEGDKALAAVATGSDTYGALARLRLGAAHAKAGRTKEAVAEFDAAAATRGFDPAIAGYARLQSAMLMVDTADWTEMQNRLNDLAADSNPWHGAARELLGMAAFKAGRLDDARREFERVLADKSVSQNVTERVGMMMAMITQAELAKSAPAGAAPAQAAPAPAVPTSKPGDKKK